MKKLILLILLFCTACGNQVAPYDQMVADVKQISTSSETLPCTITFSVKKWIEEELTYQIMIDEPKEEMYDIHAIVVHDQKTSDIFPSAGLYKDPLHLIPNQISEEKHYVKGIALVGYLDWPEEESSFHGTFKVMISYTDQNKLRKTVYQIYTK